MTTMCPNHHQVAADLDYCEECGSRVDPSAPIPAPVATSVPGDTWTCPACDTSQSLSRFCEACGESNRDHPDYVPGPAEPVRAAPAPAPAPVAPAPVSPAPVNTSSVSAPPPDGAAGERTGWTIVATADREYFDKMRAHEGPDSATIQFPAVYPPRHFPLVREQLFIGRRSRSRGIEPDIDLSAAPEDSGVSHAHAAIISTDSGWALVDVGSANGTYVNGAAEPIPVNAPTPLRRGDRIHLGAWTTLTITQV